MGLTERQGQPVYRGYDTGPKNKLKTAVLTSVFITLVSVAVLLLAGYLLSHIWGA